MGIRNRLVGLYNDIADDFNRRVAPTIINQYYYESPNVQPDVTPAVRNAPEPERLQGLPLDTFAIVVLDGSGNGTAQLGPQIVKEHWQPGSATVAVATNVNEAACALYLGSSPQSSTQLAQTSKGSSGATCALSGDMPSGYKLFAIWTGGDPGSTATLRVTGSRSIGAPQ
jgi:hypothetical protein